MISHLSTKIPHDRIFVAFRLSSLRQSQSSTSSNNPVASALRGDTFDATTMPAQRHRIKPEFGRIRLQIKDKNCNVFVFNLLPAFRLSGCLAFWITGFWEGFKSPSNCSVFCFPFSVFNSLSPESQPHFPRKSYLGHHRLYRLS